MNGFRRQSLRLPDYDYAGNGGYFVTVCTWQRECLFGDVVDGVVRLNDFGAIVRDCWDAIPYHFKHVSLDEYVIMPNHVHGILIINDVNSSVGAQHAAPDVDFLQPDTHTRAQHAAPLQGKSVRRIGATPNNVTPGSLGAVIRSFKSATTKRINALRDNAGCPVWQRNYYEHVIRNEGDLHAIREYIACNPAQWSLDENYPTNRVGAPHASPQMAIP